MTPKTLPDSATFPDPAPGQEARSDPEVRMEGNLFLQKRTQATKVSAVSQVVKEVLVAESPKVVLGLPGDNLGRLHIRLWWHTLGASRCGRCCPITSPSTAAFTTEKSGS